MEKHELAFKVGETIAIGSSYIVVSAGLITFNKYLMQRGHFPHALQLCAAHVHDYVLFFDFMYNYPINLSLHVKGQAELETTMQVYGTFRHPLCRGFVCIKQSIFLFFGGFPPILQARKPTWPGHLFRQLRQLRLRTFSWTQVMVLSIVVLGCSLSTTVVRSSHCNGWIDLTTCITGVRMCQESHW